MGGYQRKLSFSSIACLVMMLLRGVTVEQVVQLEIASKGQQLSRNAVYGQCNNLLVRLSLLKPFVMSGKEVGECLAPVFDLSYRTEEKTGGKKKHEIVTRKSYRGGWKPKP